MSISFDFRSCLFRKEEKARGKERERKQTHLFFFPVSLFPVEKKKLPLKLAHRRLGGVRLPPRPRRHHDGLLPSQQKEQQQSSSDDGGGGLDNNFPAPLFVRWLRRRRAVLFRVRALRVVLPEARTRSGRAVQDRVQVEGAVRERFFFNFFFRRLDDGETTSLTLFLDPFEKKKKKKKKRPETGRWDSPFHYCAGKCRTTSVVTVHENAYISKAHHCYSASGIPRVPPPKENPPPPFPNGARIVAGGPGETCEAACGAQGRVCSPSGALPVNDCNLLRDHFHCEAGCVESRAEAVAATTAGGAAAAQVSVSLPAPGYVVSTAPQELRPATCLTVPKAQQALACDAASPAGGEHVRRLCVCLEPGGMR